MDEIDRYHRHSSYRHSGDFKILKLENEVKRLKRENETLKIVGNNDNVKEGIITFNEKTDHEKGQLEIKEKH